jgi:hypothetical protein
MSKPTAEKKFQKPNANWGNAFAHERAPEFFGMRTPRIAKRFLRFLPIPNEKSFSAAEGGVVIQLIGYLRPNGTAYAKQEDLAFLEGVSETVARTAIRKLKRFGCRVLEQGSQSSHRASRYDLKPLMKALQAMADAHAAAQAKAAPSEEVVEDDDDEKAEALFTQPPASGPEVPEAAFSAADDEEEDFEDDEDEGDEPEPVRPAPLVRLAPAMVETPKPVVTALATLPNAEALEAFRGAVLTKLQACSDYQQAALPFQQKATQLVPSVVTAEKIAAGLEVHRAVFNVLAHTFAEAA